MPLAMLSYRTGRGSICHISISLTGTIYQGAGQYRGKEGMTLDLWQSAWRLEVGLWLRNGRLHGSQGGAMVSMVAEWLVVWVDYVWFTEGRVGH